MYSGSQKLKCTNISTGASAEKKTNSIIPVTTEATAAATRALTNLNMTTMSPTGEGIALPTVRLYPAFSSPNCDSKSRKAFRLQ